MISNYEIRKINNEEILYIYIDDNYEFANINKGKKRKKFTQMVSDFIKKNQIKFAGSTIAIIAGGLMIGNLFLNNTDDINVNNCIVSLHLNPQIIDTEVVSEDFLKNTSINTQIVDEVQKPNENQEVKTQVDVQKQETKSTKVETKKFKVEVKEEMSSNTTKIFNEAVTVFRTNGEILTLEMEEYLINVVAAEMPASFNIEALKAQSVLARTYARKAINSGKVLTDSVSNQVYKDNNQLKNMWGNDYNKYYSKIKDAVMATNGEVLKYNGELIEAVYHSTSNGYTEDAANVWESSFPYLSVVTSSLDKSVRNYEVTSFYSFRKLSNLLGFPVDNSTIINISERNESSRVSKVIIDENIYTGVELRTILNLRSADFDFEKVDGGINIITRGYGHGVGMSQYGANEMAKTGMSYKDILNHYYLGTSLTNE